MLDLSIRPNASRQRVDAPRVPTSRCARVGAFTLIELLVVIGIIALIIGITIPALGTSRETSRRLKCMANLKSLGTGVQLYQNENQNRLPYCLPLRTPDFDAGSAFLDVISLYLDAPKPTKEEGTEFYKSSDPYTCPSDRSSDDAGTNYQPIWRSYGTSYEYLVGYVMVASELRLRVGDPGRAVATVLENRIKDWPIIGDGGPRHKLRAAGESQENATYYKDKRADWFIVPSEADLAEVFAEIARTSGGSL